MRIVSQFVFFTNTLESLTRRMDQSNINKEIQVIL